MLNLLLLNYICLWLLHSRLQYWRSIISAKISHRIVSGFEFVLSVFFNIKWSWISKIIIGTRHSVEILSVLSWDRCSAFAGLLAVFDEFTWELLSMDSMWSYIKTNCFKVMCSPSIRPKLTCISLLHNSWLNINVFGNYAFHLTILVISLLIYFSYSAICVSHSSAYSICLSQLRVQIFLLWMSSGINNILNILERLYRQRFQILLKELS